MQIRPIYIFIRSIILTDYTLNVAQKMHIIVMSCLCVEYLFRL